MNHFDQRLIMNGGRFWQKINHESKQKNNIRLCKDCAKGDGSSDKFHGMNKTKFSFLIQPPADGGKFENAFCVSGTPLPVRLRVNWQNDE
jgi:hypothetical protein